MTRIINAVLRWFLLLVQPRPGARGSGLVYPIAARWTRPREK
jgi:hypothetical protein